MYRCNTVSAFRQRFKNTYIANPDLVERLQAGAPLAPLDKATLYGGGAAGYIDYPALATVDTQ